MMVEVYAKRKVCKNGKEWMQKKTADSASCHVCGLWSDQLVDVELMCGVGAR